jgi:spermidine synthase
MTRNEIPPVSISKITLLVLVCFFFSGTTGLIYEILWTRMIVKIIGGAPFAVSIILTIFMGGLGIGSYLSSRTIDRFAVPSTLVKIYGALELAIGAYALAIPALLTAFKPFYALLYNQLFSHFMLYNLLTFIGCFIILACPVICMGATLPVLCRFYVTRLSHLGTHAGRLYGLNTIGAALGALLCGFWLISILGMWGTLVFAVSINAIIGSACLLSSRTMGLPQETADVAAPQSKEILQETAQEETVLPEYPAAVNGALVIFAVSGFCAMAYEVIWTKLLGLIVGPTTYSFTIILVTFILGLALGSVFFGFLADRIKRPIHLLICTQLAAALFALLLSQLLGNSQFFFAKLMYHFQDNFALLNISKAGILFGLLVLPTLCLGATFPLVGKIYTKSVLKVGRSIGFAYAINTVGAVSGSFCAGFVLIPLAGKEKGLSLVTGLQILTSLLIAAFVLGKEKRTMLRRVWLTVPALIGILLCLHFPLWNRYLLSEGRYQRFEPIQAKIEGSGWLEALLKGPEILADSANYKLVYYGDGIGGFTTVVKHAYPMGNIQYVMLISGKPDASSREDMGTQTLSAHLPMLFHKNPKTVMVLGLASGITAGEVLYYPIEKLDVIDINRQVIKASQYFLPWNNNVLADPKTNLIIQDGRAHLLLTRQKYDCIISEPSNPWMAGLAALFTRDFFALAENRLNQDGIFVQFIHSYQMDWPTFALVGRTFAQVFPNSILVSVITTPYGADYLLVGFKGNNRLGVCPSNN